MGSAFDITAQGAVAWAAAHWVLAFIIIVLALVIVGNATRCLYLLCKFLIRSINIACRGWPPEHLDADGDRNPDWEQPEGAAIGNMHVWRGGHVHSGVEPSYIFVGEKDGSELGLGPGPVRLYRSSPL